MPYRDNRGNAPLVVLVVILAVAALGFAGIAYWQSVNGTKEATDLKDQLSAAQGAQSDLENQVADLQSQKAASDQAAADAKAQADAAAKAAADATVAALTAPDSWATSSVKDVWSDFAYPVEWGRPKAYPDGLTGSGGGTGGYVDFSKMSGDVIVWTSVGFVADGPTSMLQKYLYAQPKSCDDLQSGKDPAATIDSCETVTANGRTITSFHLSYTEYGGTGREEKGDYNVGYVTTANATYPSVAVGAPSSYSLQTVKQVLYSIQ